MYHNIFLSISNNQLLTSVLIICITTILNKWSDRTASLRKEKFTFYNNFMQAFSELLAKKHTSSHFDVLCCYLTEYNKAQIYAGNNVLKALNNYDIHCSIANTVKFRPIKIKDEFRNSALTEIITNEVNQFPLAQNEQLLVYKIRRNFINPFRLKIKYNLVSSVEKFLAFQIPIFVPQDPISIKDLKIKKKMLVKMNDQLLEEKLTAFLINKFCSPIWTSELIKAIRNDLGFSSVMMKIKHINPSFKAIIEPKSN